MNTSPPIGAPPRAPTIARLAAACMFTALCAAAAHAELIGFADLNAGLARAAAALVADRAACNQLAGNPRDVCREQALAKEKLTRAELALASTGTRKSLDYLATVKLDTAYDVARTQCNDKTGDAKTLCTKQAQAMRTQGQADLKPIPRMTSTPGDARRAADDKLAADKCATMAADTRASCMATAKATKAGKT